MSTALNEPLLQTIEPDDSNPISQPSQGKTNTNGAAVRAPVVLTPTNRTNATPEDMEAGLVGIFKQSSHPVALLFLYLFRTLAIVIYIIGGFLTDDYVLSTVAVVVLLSADFWTCRNVSGRTLVGLRFWNFIDEDGSSRWIFEARDPSRPANPIDSKMFWTAIYLFPVLWILLFIISILKLNLSFVPLVALALIFNITNAVGFTYADRDAKARWANSVVSDNWNVGFGGLGGQIMGSVVKQGVGRFFR
ncbi:Golgi apparatus membrane protein tvp23 [Serendipita sp. 411]|nr:Golgi apparatus membrane protein tvp23 [Serendipita sp. 411]